MRTARLIFISLLIASQASIMTAQVKLSFNPQKGDRYEQNVETTTIIKQNMMGQDIDVEIRTRTVYLLEIKSKSAQEAQVQVTYKEVASALKNQMMSMGFDSKNPIANPSEMDNIYSKIFTPLVGSSFTLAVGSDGTVTSVSGWEAIIDRMQKSVEGEGQIAQQLGGQLSQQFNAENMKSMFEQSLKLYPDRPVKAGDTWTVRNTTPLVGMNSNIGTTYTLKSLDKKTATLGVMSELEMLPADMMEGKLFGTQSGAATIDVKSGITMTMGSFISVKGSLKAMGMDIEMSMTVTTDFTQKKL